MLKRRSDYETWRVYARNRKDVGMSDIEFSDWYINQMEGNWLDNEMFEKSIVNKGFTESCEGGIGDKEHNKVSSS